MGMSEELTYKGKPLVSYEELRKHLTELPPTWYPDLIRAMAEASYKKNVFKVPFGCSTFIKHLEKEWHYDILSKIKLGMTREEVVAILGEPDAKGGSTRKYPTPSVFKYGDVEIHFQGWKKGTLTFVWDEKMEVSLLRS